MQPLAEFFFKRFDELIQIMENILKKPILDTLHPQKKFVFKAADSLARIIHSKTIQTTQIVEGTQSQECDFVAVNWLGRNMNPGTGRLYIHS